MGTRILFPILIAQLTFSPDIQNLKMPLKRLATYLSKAEIPKISFREPSHFNIFGGYIFKLH